MALWKSARGRYFDVYVFLEIESEIGQQVTVMHKYFPRLQFDGI